ncbi:MAG: NUDIX hydrolase domain-like protein [Monoraphidium minutum]|nr:MAG: NUDIX hydrolase domain-like protein [Monoraphidium minutum]
MLARCASRAGNSSLSALSWLSWRAPSTLRPRSPAAPSPVFGGAHAAAARAAAAGASTSAGGAGAAAGAGAAPQVRSRIYPDEPRVGVGVVCFRAPAASPEVLLVKRAKEPAKGLWCFPGGSLELGESLAECAAREVMEEAGVALRRDAGGGGAPARGGRSGGPLRAPVAFAAVDSIVTDDGGRVRFHYVVVEVAAMAANAAAAPAASDDVSEAVWMRVADLASLGDSLVPHCERLAKEALERFELV